LRGAAPPLSSLRSASLRSGRKVDPPGGGACPSPRRCAAAPPSLMSPRKEGVSWCAYTPSETARTALEPFFASQAPYPRWDGRSRLLGAFQPARDVLPLSLAPPQGGGGGGGKSYLSWARAGAALLPRSRRLASPGWPGAAQQRRVAGPRDRPRSPPQGGRARNTAARRARICRSPTGWRAGLLASRAA
jgi:hypothetical protein